jgi:protein MpaA
MRYQPFIGLLACGLISLACASSTLGEPGPLDAIGQATPLATTPAPIPTSVIAPLPTTSWEPSSLDLSSPVETSAPANTAPPALTLPTATPYPDAPQFSIGTSWEGRDIWAWRFGDGPHTIVLIGGIHGGYEANTIRLAELLVSHFHEQPDDVLPGIRLYVIPSANPDGQAQGRGLAGRLNAHQVDLNRNWGCEWADSAYLRKTPVSPGPRPFSEVETLALRAFFLTVSPDAVLFYHSAAGGIFMGQCGSSSPGAEWLGPLLDSATGYPLRRFTAYDVTGDASNWLAERDIPAAVVELYSANQPELDRNLAGVMALQCHFAITDAGGGQIDPLIQEICEAYR